MTDSPGDKYFLLDCGGGTVDSIVHEVSSVHGGAGEVDEASGGPWGSQQITKAFELFIAEVVGKETFARFKRQFPLEHYQMMERVRQRVSR